MFERYTEKARRVIFFARYEASQFGTPEIEPEHLLLALLRENKGISKQLFQTTSSESIHKEIEAATPPGKRISISMDLPLSRAAKYALAYGAEEADRLGHKHIASYHLALGVLRKDDSLAANIMRNRGVSLDPARTWAATATEEEARFEQERASLRMFEAEWFVHLPRLTAEAHEVTVTSRAEATTRNSPAIESRHLLLALLKNENIVKRYFVSATALEQLGAEMPTHAPPREKPLQIPMTAEYLRALNAAVDEADKLGHERIRPDHVLMGLLREETSAAGEFLTKHGLQLERVRAAAAAALASPPEGRNYV
jgi:ATP-dependent Clp protease ATP-binding subunit ClpA